MLVAVIARIWRRIYQGPVLFPGARQDVLERQVLWPGQSLLGFVVCLAPPALDRPKQHHEALLSPLAVERPGADHLAYLLVGGPFVRRRGLLLEELACGA